MQSIINEITENVCKTEIIKIETNEEPDITI
jgi:hypothetical protein